MVVIFLLRNKMSTTLAGAAAIVFSMGAMLACLIAVPATYQKILNIQLQLKTDMDEFQVRRRLAPLSNSKKKFFALV